ncbi:holo-ACP synthase [Ferrimonas gelatinilytica]|uniref:Holo-[acyl-carrier-protein] synthase n=1 Tax=Ferrimonas gelatinilytica TaxID=1255257 RepID=A0ABP9S7G7_9GAMM
MAIIGLGTDVVEILRIEEQASRLGVRFAQRILTPSELEQWRTHKAPSRLLAKRFAVKEAAAKALGTGIGRGVSFQHIELRHNEAGAPLLHLSGGAAERLAVLGGRHCHVSLSDERDYAVATVILES